MDRVKDSKDIIDEILDPGGSRLGWCLAIVVVIVIGLAVFLSR